MAQTLTFNGRRRVRKFFGKIPEVAEMPNLIEVQKASYDQFLMVDEPEGGRPDEGLNAVFKSVFPITDMRDTCELQFVDYQIGNWECKCGKLQGLHHLRKPCRACGHTLIADPYGDKDVLCPKCGTGNQARMQIRAIHEVMKIEEIHAWDHHPENLARYKADIEREFGIPVVMARSMQEAVEQADILITTTRGKGSLVEAAWVQPGTHIVAIGTDTYGKQEFEPEIFRGAKIVNDSIAQCLEKGETWHPLNQNIITQANIHAEIGEILLGKKPGRETDQEITIFDSTGMAIQDNTTAAKIYRNAIANQTGTTFEFIP